MASCRLATTLALVGALAACNSERKQECDKFLTAIKPLDRGTPSAETVDHVQHEIDTISYEDQPLGIYAKNYSATLSVLSNTLKLQASPSPPDGTDDVIKTNLKEARTDRDDITRYCAN